MENNENGFVPENQTPQEGTYVAPQQPAEQPAYQSYTYEQPQEAPKQNFAATGIDKVKSFAQNLDVNDLANKAKALPKKIWIMAGAALAVVIALIVLLSTTGVAGVGGNNYETPLKAAEKLLSSKKFDQVIDRAPDILNGFCESEVNKLISIAKKSEQYKDNKDDIEEGFEEAIEGIKEQFGDNYKIKFKVEDKEKLDKDDCEDFQDQLDNIGKMVKDAAEELEDMDSDDLEDAAEELGISKSQLKDGIKQIKSIGEKLKKAKATAGYELEVVVTITGSELDEPEEQELTINVFKVDGRWIPDPFSLLGMAGLNLNSLMRMF